MERDDRPKNDGRNASSDGALEEKHGTLRRRLAELAEGAPLAVAFSGGVDSTLLLAEAHALLGDRVMALMAVSPLHPRRESDEALAFLREHGIAHALLEDAILEGEELVANGPERCYHCKKALFERLGALARTHGHPRLVEGSNASDGDDYRPGARALAELGIASPLAEAGLTKDDVRRLARRRGLSQAEKPSAACLASRVRYGLPLSVELLARIEAMEDFLHDLGMAVVRARHHEGLLRLELGPDETARVHGDPALRETIHRMGRELGWTWITLDLKGYRTGSLNDGLNDDLDGDDGASR